MASKNLNLINFNKTGYGVLLQIIKNLNLINFNKTGYGVLLQII